MAWGTAVLFHLIAWMRPRRGRWPAVEGWVDRTAGRKAILDAGYALPASHVLNYATPQAANKTDPLEDVDSTGAFVAVIGTLLFAGASAWSWSGPPLTLLGIAWLAPILLLSRPGRRVGYLPHAIMLAFALVIHWVARDNLDPLLSAWNSPGRDMDMPLLNLSALAGIFIVAALIVAERFSRPQPPDLQGAMVALVFAVGFALLTFESWRLVDYAANHGALGGVDDLAIVKQVAMSVLWSLIGFASVLAGFWKRIRPMRVAALALLGVTVAKIFVIDMKNVEAVWRILSFIALGSLLLGVSYLYHRQLIRSAANES
jgi:uncharacterized membrane protein